MVRAVFNVEGSLTAAQDGALVGLTDLHLAQGPDGMSLYATTRGGGWLTAFDVGTQAGQSRQEGAWQLADRFLQLESTELVVRETGGVQQMYLAGLNTSSLFGLRLDSDGQGNAFDGSVAVSASGQNLGTFCEMALIGDGATGLAALRGGGLVNVSFGPGNTLNVSNIGQGGPMNREAASDIVTTTHNGQSYAFVSYGAADTVSMFRQISNGTMQHVTDVDASDGFWVDRPGAMAVSTTVDGGLYLVVAGSGSNSLTVMEITSNGMRPVDHLLDDLTTRFDDASHVTSITIEGQDYIIAAGSDSGLSLFAMLPGGRLQHVETLAGTADAPLRGITSLDVMAMPDGLRMWVSTEGPPYLTEFSMSFTNLGISQVATTGGGPLNGTGGDDILVGQRGADQIFAGSGDDVLMDGAGQDTLEGGTGADIFIMSQDGARDVIRDFQIDRDQLDLSNYTTIDGIGDLRIEQRAWGVEIFIGTEVLELRTANGGALNARNFNASNLILGNRIETDPTAYPGVGNGTLPPQTPPPTPPAPPPPDPTPPPAPTPPAPTPDPTPPPAPNPPAPSPTPQPRGVAPTQMPGQLPDTPAGLATPTFTMTRANGDNVASSGDDFIRSFDTDDRVFGDAGNDTINPGAGRDQISGDVGNDLVNSGLDDDLVLGGIGFDTLNGGNGADTLDGGTGADSLNGGNGNDVLLGRAGFDQIIGGNGNDTIWAGSSPDRAFGGAGNDWISAGSNLGLTVDGIFGEAGDDTLFGDGGFDLLNGGEGNDLMYGGDQADNLYGETGNDTLLGGNGLDRLFGGAGNDLLYGGAGTDGHFGQQGNDTMWGDGGRDRFFGGQGNDLIDGGRDNDSLYGGAGFDTLVGGSGHDLMEGNFNADRFVFANNHGNDTITDFNANNNFELLDFTGLSGFNSVADVLSAANQVSRDVVIDTGSGSSIRLINVDLDDLDAMDFLF